MKILSIVNQKGGVGKTTTSINLAACLHKMKRKVLLIDLDPQSNATRGSGVDSATLQSSVNDVLLGRSSIDEAIVSSVHDGYDLLPATPTLTESEVSLVSKNNREFILKNTLEDISSNYDYILMDCPPSLNILTVNSLVSATGVLIPVQCEFYALQGLSELVNTINQIQSSSNESLKIEGILRTMFDSRNNLSNDVSDQLTEYFPNELYKTKIPRNIRVAEAPSHGKSILQYDGLSKGSLSYYSLAGEIIKDE
ncbi:ParA family protein [Gammaproteobacteria bacterium]|nr:ParA family protein [Gammaproteobacteria bacterium]